MTLRKIVLIACAIVFTGCTNKQSNIEKEILETYERVEFVLQDENLNGGGIELLNIHDVINNELYYSIGDDYMNHLKSNTLFKIDLEGNVEEVMKLEEDMKIESVIIQDDVITYSAYKKTTNMSTELEYIIGRFVNNQHEEAVTGRLDLSSPIPKLTLIKDKIYSLVNYVSYFTYDDMTAEGIHLYNVSDKEIVHSVFEEEITADIDSDNYEIILGDIENQNDEVVFSILVLTEENKNSKSIIYMYNGHEVKETTIENRIAEDLIIINDNLIYRQSERNGEPSGISSELVVSKINDIGNVTVYDSPLVSIKKVKDYKDGAVVFAFDPYALDDKTINTKYMTFTDESYQLEDVVLFEYATSPFNVKTLPHGFVTYRAEQNMKVVEYLKLK